MRRAVIQPMRILLFIIILAVIGSCSSSPEDELKMLKNDWLKEDTLHISSERLQKRFKLALDYLENHKWNWQFPVEECLEYQTDTLRKQPITFKIASSPINDSKSSDIILSTLLEIWACEVNNKSYDFSVTDEIIWQYSNETMEQVNSWKQRNSKESYEVISSVLDNLPSDEESEHTALFEIPTGKTIRVHLPNTYSSINSEWDTFKKNPNQILNERTHSAHIAIIFYNDSDEIEEVWWTYWME